MTNPDLPDPFWETVLPVCDDRGGKIGTGVVVAPRQVLTALHVVEPEPAPLIGEQLPITAIVSLWSWQFGKARRLARRSHHRIHALTGEDASTVDLALLAVPDLHAPPIVTRPNAVRAAEMVTVAGYACGLQTASHGPITSTDEADFVAHVPLGPGMSGAPVIDNHGQLAGLISMNHPTAGAIGIGPALIDAFLKRAPRLLRPWRAPFSYR